MVAMSAVFSLVTLPVEFNASSRAMAVIARDDILDEREQQGARQVLSAAALPYVAALAASLAPLPRLFLLFGGGGRDRP